MSEVISVRFRNGSKNYDFDPQGLRVRTGDDVIVETAQGIEFAICTRGSHEIPDSAVVRPLCRVLRLATDADRRTMEYHRRREKDAFGIAEQKIAEHGLEMKLVNVSSSFEGNKIIFFFTADGRVDFRALVRDLAGVFRSRIELRQIGVRDEARMVGGLGICGRPFCCAQFLDTFLPVSIKMAKTQNLSLNPAKISGACGRLMCCLKYEQYAYEDAARRLPKPESFVQTPDGPGNVKAVDLLRETVKVSLDSEPEPPRTYHADEVILLRGGKGSREGIELPPRPARHVEEKREDTAFEPVFLESYEWDGADEAPGNGGSGQRAASDRRGGQSGRKNTTAKEAGAAGRNAAFQRQADPDKNAPFQSQSGRNAPFQSQSGRNAPFQSQNGRNAPFQSQNGGNAPFQSQNGRNVPFQSQNGRNAPFQSRNGGNAPFQSQSGRNAPFQSQSGGNPTAQGKGGRNAPFQSQGTAAPSQGGLNRGGQPPERTASDGRGGQSGFSRPSGAYGRNPPPTAEDWADFESMTALSSYGADEYEERHRNRNQNSRRGQQKGRFQKQGREFQKKESSYEAGEQKRRGNRNYYRGSRRNRGGGKAPD